MNLLKKGLLGVAIAIAVIAILFVPLALGLMAGFPFALWTDEKFEPVGARATFEESADCLFQHRHYSAGRDLGVRLDSKEVAFCFPPQTPATRKALIACFNKYEQEHDGHVGWPEDNMQGCAWAGVTDAAPDGFAFGEATAVPAMPRVGKRFRLTVGVMDSDFDANAAVQDDAVAVSVTIGDGTPLSYDWGADADGKIYVEFTVPETTEGMPLTIILTPAAHSATGEKIVTFTVGRQ